jgi:hypothetical protein
MAKSTSSIFTLGKKQVVANQGRIMVHIGRGREEDRKILVCAHLERRPVQNDISRN